MLNNGKYCNHHLELDYVFWSRHLWPCIDVEQGNCYFCICGLNGLLIFNFACKKTEQWQKKGRRAEPTQVLPLRARPRETNCSDSPFSIWKSVRKITVASYFLIVPILITHSEGQWDSELFGFSKHLSLLKLRDLLPFIARPRTKCQMVLPAVSLKNSAFVC